MKEAPVTWYEITKDIILPALTLVSTIVLGTIIAIALKRKEEKAKIKTLLIDNYMAYLNIKIKFIEYEANTFTYELLKDIYINYGSYFTDHANRHMPLEQVGKRRDKLKAKIDAAKHEEHNWSPYTFKFCFLLGTKLYRKKAQGLENELVDHYLSIKGRDVFRNDLKATIKKHQEIRSDMDASNVHKINDALDRLESLIEAKYIEFQAKYFMPYDNAVADLIDRF